MRKATNSESESESKLSGAVTTQAALIGLRFQAKLQLGAHKRSLSALAGPYRASFRGRGMDFEEVRAYQPGDDVRSIDWRVTARTGDPHTKLFKEERERPVMLLIDQRQAMYFGSNTCFKSVLAAEIAGIIAWSALRQNDRVGGMIIGKQELIEIRPKRSKSSVLQLLHAINEQNNALQERTASESAASETNSIANALEELRRVCKPGSAVFIISDFHDFDEEASKHLFHLAKHNEVTSFFVHDQLEQRLPPPGLYDVTDGQQRNTLNTRDSQLQDEYQQAFNQRKEWLQQQMARGGAPMVSMQTGCEPLNQLLNYYAYQRQKR